MDIKCDFQMFSDGVKPVKSAGLHWIDHQLRAMERMIDKFGLYTRHVCEYQPLGGRRIAKAEQLFMVSWTNYPKRK